MAANEVNDIVIRLLAIADKIGGREGEDIMYYVGRLSRAATRERNAAVDEIQRLRTKIGQQSAELRRLGNLLKNAPALPVVQGPFASQPPLAGGHGGFAESRLQALDRGTTPGLAYGAGYGRLSRPEGLAQPMRKPTSVETPTNAPADASSAQRQIHPVQDQPGYGLFNPARFLALQSDAPTTPPSNPDNERSSLSDGPPPPKYAVTAANAEPVVPRSAKRGAEPAERRDSTKQAVDQLLEEIRESQHGVTGSKRRASAADDTMAPTAKRQATVTGVPSTGAYSNTVALNGYSTMPLSQRGTPTCTHCFKSSWKCDGRSHCGQCNSNKCLYVLCDPETCLGAACVKIHSSQYDFAARKPGQARRFVLGDNLQISAMKMSRDDRSALYSLVIQMGQRTKSMSAAGTSAHTSVRAASMDRLPLAGLPFPSHATREERHTASVDTTSKDSESEDNHPFSVPKAVREAASMGSLLLTSDSAYHGSSDHSSGVKVERGDQ